MSSVPRAGSGRITAWWRPQDGWFVLAVERTDDAVLVTMGHPEWRERLHIQAPDEGLAIGWANLRRSGTGQWFKRKTQIARAPDAER